MGGGGGSHSAGGGRRPVKVWNSGRTIRKALVVSTYDEFQRKGREKLGLSSEEPISVVLEGDGTQVKQGLNMPLSTGAPLQTQIEGSISQNWV